ncbi:putative transcriptional regulator, CadC [Shewanella halifaxensis HAW-EB4]|uniref:Transcriptional regulator, CadC n=1 Tax=Shewanella halifaxensis (strain HAW-EB4) TaxID=458817 RepID=B0TUC4_SHEHH|nr:CadC family transcriptional regulator [Shewanella halifaxensis]ABZ75424.1 putative transcriptional regulator, CadC [Shewanella halifaxensis HAW-EB4]
MYIGPYRFDVELKELIHIDSEKASAFKLSNIEFSVLEQLQACRGQVVSIESIRDKFLPTVVTHHDISRAVQNIKRFLGAEHASWIEAIAKQGYLLHISSQKKPMLNRALHSASLKNYLMCLILGIFLLVFLVVNLATTSDIRLSVPDKIQIKASESILVPIYNSDKDREDYQSRVKEFGLLLGQCEVVKWQRIYLAPSSDGNQLQFVMNNIADDGKACRNLKVTNVAKDWHFIDLAWLKEAGICE